MNRIVIILIVFCIFAVNVMIAGNTGKISGRIIDAETNTGLPGVNVMIVETKQGAITDINGFYVILNVPPGEYTLRVSMISYASTSVSKVVVNIDRTTNVNIQLKPQVIQGEEVQVIASRPIVSKDVAASTATLSQSQIEALPVTTITQVMGLEAGITTSGSGTLTIRGGGEDQTTFMLDGANMKDARTLNSYFKVSLNSVKEIQVQKGGFNAEYGDARSGVINVVTRDGSPNLYNFGITLQMHPPTSKHFGMSIYDPMSYWNRPYLDPTVCWTGTNSGAWDIYTQGQYPSFVGWNAISDQSMQDADPNKHLTPAAAQRLYMYQRRIQGDIKKPDYNIDVGFGGPVPFVSEMLGNLRFFTSFVMERSMYLIPMSRADYQNWNGTIKINSDISGQMKLLISGLYGKINGVNNNNAGSPGLFYSAGSVASILSQVNYIPTRIWVPDYYCPSEITRNSISAKLTYIFSEKTLAEFTIQESGTSYKTGPNPLRNTSLIQKFGNNYWVDEGPYGFYPYGAPGIGDQNFRMGFGMSNSRDTSSTSIYSVSGSITSQLNESNQIKSGFEFLYYDESINSATIELTLPTGNNEYKYSRYPLRGAFYIQDKIEFEQLVVNAGVRLDYSDPNGMWYDLSLYDPLLTNKYGASLDELAIKTKAEKQINLSPRLAISHPITENSKLYFNYTHTRQLPSPDNLYQISRGWDQSISYVANPNLPLQKTVMYELGYDHNLFDMFLLQASAYYKDVTDEPYSVRYTSADSKVNYLTTTNNLYADIRGFELTIRKDRGDWVNGFINYTYQVSSSGYFDYARYYENPADQRAYITTNPIQSKPLPTPYARANIEFRSPADFGPEFGGIKLLSNWRISVLPSWSTGGYFTYPTNVPGLQNNLQWKDSYGCDFRFSKNINLGKLNLELLCDIRNIFNVKNFTTYGFYDGTDYKSYLESLHFPQEVADLMGAPYNTHYGNDRPGDVRDEDTPYDPTSTDSKTKAYINMPNQSSLIFLNPRYINWGLRISYNY